MALDVLKRLPSSINGLDDVVIAIGKRDDAQDLREVGVAGRADEQSVGFAALLCGIRAEPGSGSVAHSEGTRGEGGRVGHRPFGLARTPDPDLAEVAAGPALVDPELPPAVAVTAVDEVNQSMSPMWPRRQARTKRIGTTDRLFLSSSSMNWPREGRCGGRGAEIGWLPSPRRPR